MKTLLAALLGCALVGHVEPMKTGKLWEGVPEFDKSSRSHSVQLAAPVLDKGKPIGVLVIGLSMKAMKETR